MAYPKSGEGIRPAIESGLLAAQTIVEADGRYAHDLVRSYEERLRRRLGGPGVSRLLARAMPSSLAAALVPRLLGARWFVRHVMIGQWFLHAGESGSSCREAHAPDREAMGKPGA